MCPFVAAEDGDLESLMVFLVIVSLFGGVLLLAILWALLRMRTTLDSFLREYRKEQEAREKVLLRATADILRALKERDREDVDRESS